MKKIHLFLMAAGLASLVYSSCGSRRQETAKKDDVKASPKETSCAPVSYAAGLEPIIGTHCGKTCHSASKRAGGIDLSTYEMVKEEARKPRFIGAIKHDPSYSPMPKKAPRLSDSAIAVVTCWIESGMYP